MKTSNKCIKNECLYEKHTNISNNGGLYCCKACRDSNTHGPICKKILLSNINKLIFLRHYIFIDPYDINSNNENNEKFQSIKKIHSENYTDGEKILYYNYEDIKNLLEKYDIELYNLYIKINYKYAALLADIGRYIILYNYGGIYHDLKCWRVIKI